MGSGPEHGGGGGRAWWLLMLVPVACCLLPAAVAAVGTGLFVTLWSRGYGFAAIGALLVAAGTLAVLRWRGGTRPAARIRGKAESAARCAEPRQGRAG